MKLKEAINLINNNEEIYSLWQAEEELPEECHKLAEGVDLDKHRWYSIATNYYQCEDGILGIRGAFQSFNEVNSWSDIDIHSEAFEGESFTTVGYRPKK